MDTQVRILSLRMKYKQCEIVQELNFKINKKEICYLPERFAKAGKCITIKNLEGYWLVTKVFNSLDEKYCIERSQDYKKQREASDI